MPHVTCPEEYNALCKKIWLKLILLSKPYLSTFTHIYPYTMCKEIPTEPGTLKGTETPSGMGTPKKPRLNSFTESLRPRLNSLAESSLSQASSGSLMLSGLLIPKSLSSLVTQTQADALLEKSQQSQRSRKGSVTDDSASDMDDVATYWDDEEKIAYGREKVFSYTGYQLQLPSLIGILYAAARILHLDLLPRDFQL